MFVLQKRIQDCQTDQKRLSFKNMVRDILFMREKPRNLFFSNTMREESNGLKSMCRENYPSRPSIRKEKNHW